MKISSFIERNFKVQYHTEQMKTISLELAQKRTEQSQIKSLAILDLKLVENDEEKKSQLEAQVKEKVDKLESEINALQEQVQQIQSFEFNEKFTKHREEIRLESERFKTGGNVSSTPGTKEESSDDEDEQFYDARDTLSASVSGSNFPCSCNASRKCNYSTSKAGRSAAT